MRPSFVLLALFVTTYSQENQDCVVSDFGEWSECKAQKCDKTVNGREDVQAESFHMETPVIEDKGRQMMKIMTEEKIKQFEEKMECMSNNTCPEARNGPTSGYRKCDRGMAGKLYPCLNVNQLSHISLEDLVPKNSSDPDLPHFSYLKGTDIWGWTDPQTGDEYAMIGLNVGTTFIRVTSPSKPQVLAFLATRTYTSGWRDVKVFNNTAYIVSEASKHGMQVFDLLRLRDMNDFQVVKQDAEYLLFGNAHNIVANEDTGFLYSVGATRGGYNTTCKGGFHMIDVRHDRLDPKYAGCFGIDGYTHDAQCVIYHGPDVRYKGHELCFGYNEDTLTIVDVTDKAKPTMVSRVGYTTSMYTHQGWLTEDHTIVLMDDELDESRGEAKYTLTYIWDVTNLRDPVLKNTFTAVQEAIDHNQYVRGDLVYQSNYGAGLRILHIDQDSYDLQEVAYFDVYPSRTEARFEGTWSNYPYFPSENVLISSIEYGLFVVRPDYEAIRVAVKKHTQYARQQRMRKVLYASQGASCPNMEEYRLCKPTKC